MELREVFSAEPKSIYQLLCDPGTGFYVPAYQREYTWGKDKIERLFEDTLHGLTKLIKNDDAITFLGTLIVIHDTKYATVAPISQGNMPPRVLLLIDGQQRATTLLILATALHEEITRRLKSIGEKELNEEAFWIRNQCLSLKESVESTFRIYMTYGDSDYKFYPRLIRAFVDSWSRYSQSAVYNSPVSNLLFNYSKYCNNPTSKFDFIIPDGLSVEEAKKYDSVKKIRKVIIDEISKLADGKSDETEFPDLSTLAEQEEFQLILFKTKINKKVLDFLGSSGKTGKQDLYLKQLFRIALFTKFLLERVAVTVVSAKNEDYAFDMFESLNTTGEALTAFETFKPKVIEAETLHLYEKSPSRKSLLEVEGYLDNFQGAQLKHTATSALLIPFALSEIGFKLSKRLSDQRSFLRDNFDKLPSLDEKRSFVKHLEHNSIFTRNIWNRGQDYSKENDFPKFKEKQTIEMALKVLKDLKHDISIAILVRFYSHYRSVSGHGTEQALSEFQDAIKACLAFFVLWRGSRKDTDNIDSYYRKIMSDGIPELGISGFCRRNSEGSNSCVSSKYLKDAFRYILRNEGDIVDKAHWIKKAAIQPIYKAHTLCKFMLFAATHDTQPHPDGFGLSQKTKKIH